MKLPAVAPFAHLFGIRDKAGAKAIATRTPLKKSGVQNSPASSSRAPASAIAKPKAATPKTALARFNHLIGEGSAHRANARANHYAVSSPAATAPSPTPMTAAEAAQFIVEAGVKRRGAGEPRRKIERIADMTARAKVDSATGIAAQIINAGRRARGETL